MKQNRKNLAILLMVSGTTAVFIINLITNLHAAYLVSITRITFSSDEDRISFSPVVNADGTKIAFVSDSDLLNTGTPNNINQIWLYDTETMTYTLVTNSPVPLHNSFAPSISDDGTRIAFESYADLLDEGLHSDYQIWFYDTTTGIYTRTTFSSGPVRNNLDPAISGDGTKIAFRTDSDLLGEGIKVGEIYLWLYDIETDTHTRITPEPASGKAFSSDPSLNYDGSIIAFESKDDLLNDGVAPGRQLWLYDTNVMTFTRITAVSGNHRLPSISADGTRIAFLSSGNLLNEPTAPIKEEVWLYDTSTMTYTRVTTTLDPDDGNARPTISRDGTAIAFSSRIDFLNEGEVRNAMEAWLYHIETQTLTRLTTTPESFSESYGLGINGDGTAVVIQSESDLTDENIEPRKRQIWLAEIEDVPLHIVDDSPFDEEIDVPVNTDILVLFSEPIQTGTGKVTVHLAANDAIVQSVDMTNSELVSITDRDLAIDLPQDLRSNTDYYILMEAGAVQDLLGNNFVGVTSNTAWEFTTVEVDSPVEIVEPVSNTHNVISQGFIEIPFSEAIQAGEGMIQIHAASDGMVVAELDVMNETAVQINSQTLKITLPSDLEMGETYYLTMPRGIVKDLAGNSFVGFSDPSVWRFMVMHTSIFLPLIVH